MLRAHETLKQSERDEILSELNEAQRKFVEEMLKRGKRTAFANVLARGKASDNDDGQIAERWGLIDYIDAGPDWQHHSKLYCECGRALRYQYVLQNKETGEIKKFGIKHFEEHTGIPPQLAREIIKGIEEIDYELDELLYKISYGWNLENSDLDDLPAEVDIPGDIQAHLDLNLPLLNRQVARLRKVVIRYYEMKRKERQEELLRQKIKAEKQREQEYVKEKESVINKLQEIRFQSSGGFISNNTTVCTCLPFFSIYFLKYETL